ncbi:hypothetical protein [Nocardia carnea]|uniref:hypothetical protein n=1 Tax=Nocardia carnea TaxID=37328 RepID=UPI0024549E36|nr:hypothetical protein [Nocardia carnea]
MSDTWTPRYVLRGRVVPDPLALYPTPKGMAEPAPVECRRGHRFGPNLCTVGWVACVAPGRNGHRTHTCLDCGDVVMTPAADEHCECGQERERWARPGRQNRPGL